MQGRSFLQEQEEDWYTNYTRLDDKNFHFAIVASDSDTIIGTVSLMDVRRPHDRADGRRSERGEGREIPRARWRKH
jgi:RimJ/RimL family protein N-acetyltransferase